MERGNLSSFVFLPRGACLILQFFLFPPLVPWDRGSLSIKHHPQSQALFVKAGDLHKSCLLPVKSSIARLPLCSSLGALEEASLPPEWINQ